MDTLEFSHVTFCYEGSSTPSLQDVSLILRAGERLALVGHNGAGKSTLVKLMMRLYDPTEGHILLNGVDIREYNLHAYRRLIGAAFQDFQMFPMSIAENALMEKVTTEEQRAWAVEALKQSGIYDKISSLPGGVNAILTWEFDEGGVMLSGGQFQKIAVARAFARPHRHSGRTFQCPGPHCGI